MPIDLADTARWPEEGPDVTSQQVFVFQMATLSVHPITGRVGG
jgi:hypothetical protein